MNTVFRHALALAVLLAGSVVACAAGDHSKSFAVAPDARATGKVAGKVTTSDGAPIANAVVTLQGARASQSGRTDAAGHFSIPKLMAGTYAIRVSALGFEPLGPRPIGVAQVETTDIVALALRSSSSLATIGRVAANGGEALSTSSAPVTTIDPQTYATEGFARVSDILQDDISTTLVHPVGGSTVLPTSVALRGPIRPKPSSIWTDTGKQRKYRRF